MAKIVMKGTGDFMQVALHLHQEIMKGALSIELAGETRMEHGDVCITLRVYDKFFYRASNRVSLAVQIAGVGEEITVTAIASGGGQGVLFKMDWGAEKDFSYVVVSPLRKLGFTMVSER